MADDPLKPESTIRKIERVPNPGRSVLYSNNAFVVSTQWDIQMYFSFVHEVTPGNFAGVEQALVVMTPEHALQLLRALQKNLESYEAGQGKIRDIKPVEVPKAEGKSE